MTGKNPIRQGQPLATIDRYAHRRPIFFRNKSRVPQDLLVFLAICILMAVAYVNGMDAEWHLDDFDNIVNNGQVHLKHLSGPALWNTLHGMEKTGGHISRPLAYLSFALNYYFNGLHVFGYHLVNLVIHCLASFFLFLLIRSILVLPVFKGRYERQAFGIAFAATILWATSPLQVTAVTYIVQRMASMAGLFYIMSLFFYLKGRTSPGPGHTVIFLAMSLLSALCAFGTKENAAMLPVIVLIFEILFLQRLSGRHTRNILLITGLVLLAVSAAVLWFVDLTAWAGNYGIRPFTMEQRLLTEPRVILLYVSWLFFPDPSRLMLYHDIAWSTSLVNPFTTIVSIAAIGSLALLGLLLSRTRPLIAFCILFFLINHIIEGSFFSLELIFEHRNYIPSMFFFLPWVVMAAAILEKPAVPTAFKACIMAGFVLAGALQMYGTHTRNTVFHTRMDLLKDNLIKAPRLSVIDHNLGVEYYNGKRYREAREAYMKALQEDRYMNIQQKGLTHYNLGIYYQYVAKDMKRAAFHYDEGKRYGPDKTGTRVAQPVQNRTGMGTGKTAPAPRHPRSSAPPTNGPKTPNDRLGDPGYARDFRLS